MIKAGRWAGTTYRLRMLVIIIAASLLLWFTFVLTVAFVIGPRDADLAMRWGATTADVEGAAAIQIMRDRPRRADLNRARALAVSALESAPMNVQALDVLGILAEMQGQGARAARLFNYSESLSRRDLATQLWQIEASVRRDDIAGAMLHYDRALRTSNEAPALLFPVLRQAAAHDDIGPPLARILNSRPPWWIWFAYSMVEDSQTTPEAYSQVFGRIRLNMRDLGERVLLTGAINRLVAAKRYQIAYQIYRRHTGSAGQAERPLRDGGFEREVSVPPFGWYFADDNDLSGVRERVDAAQGEFALRIYASGGREGEAARQLLLLPAGHYDITLRVGAVQSQEAFRPTLVLRCATDDVEFTKVRLPTAPAAGASWRGRISVPSGCPAQWLAIKIRSNIDAEATAPWIDAIDVRPSRP